jgi:hypothetical protein
MCLQLSSVFGGRSSISNLRTCHAVVTGTHLSIFICVLYHPFSISNQILRNTNRQHTVVMYQLHRTCTYVESKFKTSNYIRFSHTPSTKNTSTCWSEWFYVLYVYVLLYLYFIPFHISQTWLGCPSHDNYLSKFKLFPNPDYVFETSEGPKMTCMVEIHCRF